MIKTAVLVVLLGLVMTASGATLADNYVLSSSLNDTLGGPALVADGGTIGATGYSFGANQGLNLSSSLSNSGDYSILMDFSFATLGSFRKILDFQNLTVDFGLYTLGQSLDFFDVASGGGSFSANVVARVVLTRDAGSKTVTGYVNGAQQLTFTDNTPLGVFSGTNNIIRFFEDDAITGHSEATAGLATEIQIYHGALSSAEVAALGGPGTIPTTSGVPEPGAMTLAGLGLLALGLMRRIKA